MSRAEQRRTIEDDEARRKAARKHLTSRAPQDPMLAVAYWTEVVEFAREQLEDAVVAARGAGVTWGLIGLAHRDRTPQTAQRKFGHLMPPG